MLDPNDLVIVEAAEPHPRGEPIPPPPVAWDVVVESEQRILVDPHAPPLLATEWRPGDSRTDADRVFDRIELAQQGMPYTDRNGEIVDPRAFHGDCCPCAACATARSED